METTRIAVPSTDTSDDPPEGHLHVRGFAVGDVIGILAGLLLVGFFGLQLQSAYVELVGDGGGGFNVSAADMWFNSAILLVVLGLLPWLWVLTTRRAGWRGMIDYFGLAQPGRPLLQGVGLGFGLVLLLLVGGLIMQALGVGDENPAIGSIQAILSWPLVIAISLSAALGEELLFRGIIQKHIGVWAQAVVFGLLHAYQGIYGVIITALLALLFGYIVKRRGSLWIPIAAHFTFDFVQLSLLMIAPEAA